MIDTCKPRQAGRVVPQSPKTFDELNKPLFLEKNKEEVARKITEFQESILNQFGSSQVPTPAIKDFYKQCAGGPTTTSLSSEDASMQQKLESDVTAREPGPLAEAVCGVVEVPTFV